MVIEGEFATEDTHNDDALHCPERVVLPVLFFFGERLCVELLKGDAIKS